MLAGVYKTSSLRSLESAIYLDCERATRPTSTSSILISRMRTALQTYFVRIERCYPVYLTSGVGYGWRIPYAARLRSWLSMERLGNSPPPGEESERGTLDWIKQVMPVIQELAPRWLELIERATQETRPRNPTAINLQTGDEAFNIRRTVIIFGILSHLMRPNRSTNFQTVLGLYLYQGGARRRVLDTQCQLGLIMSYSTLQRRMEKLTGKAERQVQLVGQTLSGVITYDNFDFAEGKRGESAGDQRVFRSITTCLAIVGRAFEGGPLYQHMWQPHSCPLSVEHVAGLLVPRDEDWLVRPPHLSFTCVTTHIITCCVA